MKWRRIIVLVGMSLAIVVAGTSETQPIGEKVGIEQGVREARQISAELAEKVRGLLFQELEKGGVTHAVRVCSELAQQMTQQFTGRTGHNIRRVSLRYRNPKNAPDDYERRKLEQLDLINLEKKLENDYFEVVKDQGRETLRYMKPLIVVPVCLTCHGPKENIPSEVRTILLEKYPDDRATGFLVGDVRGAISVKITLTSLATPPSPKPHEDH